jgi:hypothetical protein
MATADALAHAVEQTRRRSGWRLVKERCIVARPGRDDTLALLLVHTGAPRLRDGDSADPTMAWR